MFLFQNRALIGLIKMDGKILILGASGFLGNEVYQFFKNQNCIGTSFSKDINGLIKLDLTKDGELERLIQKTKPQLIINSLNLGGFLDKNPEQTKRVNYGINQELARVFDGKIVFFSTDSVFDGECGDYIETDRTNPINNYGKTKELGESVLIDSNKDALILRLGILYKDRSKGYVRFVYDNLKVGKAIDAWKEIVACPTHTDDVCYCLDYLLKQNAQGIYHLAGQEKISRYEFALRIANTFELDSSLINCPVYSGEIKRPKDTSLKSIKLKIKLRGVEIG